MFNLWTCYLFVAHIFIFSNLCCTIRLDPEAHEGESPRAVELAAVNGCVETFALLTARLEIDSNSVWFQLAQVCVGEVVSQKSKEFLGANLQSMISKLLVWAMSGDGGKYCYNWKPSADFKKLLASIPPAKVNINQIVKIIIRRVTQVSKESVCGSTLLQSFARAGNRAGVALLLQHGFVSF